MTERWNFMPVGPKYVFDATGMTRLRTDWDDNPVCGEFCDACGDCLYCYGDHDCVNEGDWHIWVQYGEDKDDTKTTPLGHQ